MPSYSPMIEVEVQDEDYLPLTSVPVYLKSQITHLITVQIE